jgi:hypothetical protein
LPARRLAIAEHLRRTAVPDAPTILSKKVFDAVEQLTEGLDRGPSDPTRHHVRPVAVPARRFYAKMMAHQSWLTLRSH